MDANDVTGPLLSSCNIAATPTPPKMSLGSEKKKSEVITVLSVMTPWVRSSGVVRQLCGCALTQWSIPKCCEISKGQIVVASQHSARKGDEVFMKSCFHLRFCRGAKIPSVLLCDIDALSIMPYRVSPNILHVWRLLKAPTTQKPFFGQEQVGCLSGFRSESPVLKCHIGLVAQVWARRSSFEIISVLYFLSNAV